MKLNHRGDTLIEVLVSLTIIGLVLGSSFGLASRSYRIGQRTQERLEALKVLESQIEQSKIVFANSADLFTNNKLLSMDPFCINSSDLTTINSTSDRCKQGTNGRYRISIDAIGTNNDLEYKATWDRFGGGTDQIIIPYKYYR